MKITALFERFFQSTAGSVEPDLDVVHRQAEDLGNLGVGKSLNVLEDQGFSVFLRKTVNESPYSRVHLFTYGNVIKGSGGRCSTVKAGG